MTKPLTIVGLGGSLARTSRSLAALRVARAEPEHRPGRVTLRVWEPIEAIEERRESWCSPLWTSSTCPKRPADDAARRQSVIPEESQ